MSFEKLAWRIQARNSDNLDEPDPLLDWAESPEDLLERVRALERDAAAQWIAAGGVTVVLGLAAVLLSLAQGMEGLRPFAGVGIAVGILILVYGACRYKDA